MGKNRYYSSTSAYDEAIRTLRTNIQFSDIDNKFKKILVTSSIPNEGKTTISVGLASSFAENGFKVLLIDCDLRSPSMHKEFQTENSVGLTNLLLDKKKISNVIKEDSKQENLHVIFSGPTPPNPSEILSSHKMREIIETLEKDYDYIIIDTPPAGMFSDAAVLSSTVADGVIIVTRSNYTKKDQLKYSIDSIDKVGGKFIGVVMTFVEKENSNYGSYY